MIMPNSTFIHPTKVAAVEAVEAAALDLDDVVLKCVGGMWGWLTDGEQLIEAGRPAALDPVEGESADLPDTTVVRLVGEDGGDYGPAMLGDARGMAAALAASDGIAVGVMLGDEALHVADPPAGTPLGGSQEPLAPQAAEGVAEAPAALDALPTAAVAPIEIDAPGEAEHYEQDQADAVRMSGDPDDDDQGGTVDDEMEILQFSIAFPRVGARIMAEEIAKRYGADITLRDAATFEVKHVVTAPKKGGRAGSPTADEQAAIVELCSRAEGATAAELDNATGRGGSGAKKSTATWWRKVIADVAGKRGLAMSQDARIVDNRPTTVFLLSELDEEAANDDAVALRADAAD